MHQPLDHLRSRKRPVTKPVWIALDSDVADRLIELQQKLERAETLLEARPLDGQLAVQVEALADEVDDATEDFRSNAAKFVARSLGANAYEELMSHHPATKDQITDAKKQGVMGVLGFNTDTFPKVLTAACVRYVSGQTEDGEDILEELTEEYVKEMYESEEWNEAELTALFEAAYNVNSTRRVVDLGNGSRRTRSS